MSWAPSSGWQAGSSQADPSQAAPRSRRTLEIVGVVFGFFYFWPAAIGYLAWKFAGYPIPKDWARFRDGGIPNPFRDMNFGHMGFGAAGFTQTGNLAFDEYRRGEIRRLEAERRKLDEDARAFRDFVDDLKRAKDREEFDAFMRRRREGGTTSV